MAISDISDFVEVLGMGLISGIGFAYLGKFIQVFFDAVKKFF